MKHDSLGNLSPSKRGPSGAWLPMPGRHWEWGTGVETLGLRKLLGNLVADWDTQYPSSKSPCHIPRHYTHKVLFWGKPHRRLIQFPESGQLGIYLVPHHMPTIELPELANKNTGCPVKFEFQIINEKFFNITMSQILHRTYLHQKCICCLPKIEILHGIHLN